MGNFNFKKRRDFLPIGKPTIGKQEIKAVTEILKSGWITTGHKTLEFEERFKKYIGAKHAVALNSCTSALELALAALNVGRNDEVILSPLTFVSEANVIVHLGARPVFADITPHTLNIDPQEIKKRISKRTKAIIVTHFAGQPCDMDKIKAIARKNKIHVVEDAAHALGAQWHGKKIGSDPGTIGCFSFYPIKNITTAEGGMLTTGNKKIADRIRILSLHGLSKNAWSRYSKKGSWEYDVIEAGYKCNMPDILAALGIEQLKRLDSLNKKRATLANTYIKELRNLSGVRFPKIIKGVKHSWQIFPVLLDTNLTGLSRNQIIERLAGLNVGTSVHFKPVHLFGFYRKTFGFKRGQFPVCEHVSGNILSLPLFPQMTPDDVNYVINSLKEIIIKK